MKNQSIKKLIFHVIISFIVTTATAQDGKFSFTLSLSARTSAGVFKNDSILVRTLWNDERLAAGNYTKSWDGKDDYGNSINKPDASYKVKVLSNNVQYIWQGTVGNSSDKMTGPTKHKAAYDNMKGLVFAGGFGYFCTGYGEGNPSVCKFNISTPNQKANIYSSATTTGDVNYVATDGARVYWGCYDSFSSNNSWVFGTNVSDDAEVPFSSGSSYTLVIGYKTYYNAISKLNQANSQISGLTVQKIGNYLFVARKDLGQLQVINKVTGALVQTLNYTLPRNLCVDAGDNLWMVTGSNTVGKYTVNANGSLSGATLTLSGLLDPLSIQVNNDGSIVSVNDGGTCQQVKFFNNSTGVVTGSFGVAGGYFTDATVTDNKFYFNDVRGNRSTFLAYQPDGSFWVNDPGNFRTQHYSAAGSFINRIMSIGAVYSMGVDKGNISRVFAEYLEFSIDYSVQALSGSSGWSLVKNWGANVSAAYDNFVKLKPPVTLSNGRTYSFLNKLGTYPYKEVVELTSTGSLRFTGLLLSNIAVLCSDGSLQDYSEAGGASIIKRFPLSSFDGLGNPIWSSAGEMLATVPAHDATFGGPGVLQTAQVFSGTKVVFYNTSPFENDNPSQSAIGYHVGIASRGQSSFLAQTELPTHRNYGGNFPKPGRFDIGNDVNFFAGGNINIIDRNIITSYHGEFWKASQANKYNHYYDNGLAIGQFGTTGPEVGYGIGKSSDPVAEFAGNVLNPILVKDFNGDLYLWTGDEGVHAALHRWKITGLNTIAEQTITLSYPSSYALGNLDYTDLMEGLPFDAVLVNNTIGWTRSPTSDGTNWKIKTSNLTYERAKDIDVFADFNEQTATVNTLNRDLGINNVSNSWKVSGEICWGISAAYNDIAVSLYFEILDEAGKVLTTIYQEKTGNSYPLYTSSMKLNNAILFSNIQNYSTVLDSVISKLRPFTISIINGVVSFKYSNYPILTTSISDPSGNWRKPKTLRARFQNSGFPASAYGRTIDFSNLKFYKDFSLTPPTNQAPSANAGNDLNITLPVNSTTLSGNGVDSDGTITNYSWVKIYGPPSGTIVTANTAITVINNLVQGVYQYELTVTDNGGAVGKDTVQVTVNAANNIAPSAIAGNDVSITLPVNSVNLSGSGADTDGTISNYNWVKISGPAAGTIATANAATTMISNLVQGIYQYELTVKDNGGAVGKDTVQVIVNAARNIAPSANAGSNIIITLPVNSTTLSGTGTDSDGTISSYSWVKISGPASGKIVTANTAITVINNLVQGVYQYELTVTDNGSAVGKDTVQVTVNAARNIAPSANAGSDIIITLPVNSANLSGSGLDQDGTISNYSWSKISGPSSGTILNANAANTTINNLVEGIYQYELTVTDNGGAVGKDTVQVNVRAAKNTPPAANAGNDITIVLPVSSATLRGSGTDMNGVIISYAWTKISGPATGMIANANGPVTVINNLVQGVYNFELTVTDNKGEKGKDTVQVTVNQQATINKLPVANAGADLNIVLPANNAMLNGKGFDPDGSITSYSWKVISGPTGYNFSSAQLATTKINNLFQGIYNLELTVMDNNGAFAKDTMSITVSSPRLSNYTANALTVYPNPVADIANLNINTINAKTKLSIAAVDVRGRLVKYQEMVTGYNDTLVKLDMSTLSNGYYIITLKFDDGRQISTKVIKYGGK